MYSDDSPKAVQNEGVIHILHSVGLESVHDIQVAGSTKDIDGDANSLL